MKSLIFETFKETGYNNIITCFPLVLQLVDEHIHCAHEDQQPRSEHSHQQRPSDDVVLSLARRALRARDARPRPGWAPERLRSWPA